MSQCRWRPGPHFYRHWTCQRRRFHLGRHRSISYTWPRLPRRLQWRFTRYEPKGTL